MTEYQCYYLIAFALQHLSKEHKLPKEEVSSEVNRIIDELFKEENDA